MEGERREPDPVSTSSDERAQRALSFGQVAELYDQRRPGYPDALYADVLEFGPGRQVLEAGAGTGRATLELARRRASVVAVEPDGAMAAVARQRTQGMAVDVRESMFEDCTVTAGAFDLVVAAQAWHWVDQVRGAAVAARALHPDGALCVWWNRPRELTGPVWDAIHAVYAEHAPALDRRDVLRQQPVSEQQSSPLRVSSIGPHTATTGPRPTTPKAMAGSFRPTPTICGYPRSAANGSSTVCVPPSPARASVGWNTATAPCS
jgi:SAM-dependent methyltransferase